MENRKPKLNERVGLKVFAVFIAIILFAVCFFSALLTVMCIQNDVYADGGEQFMTNAVYKSAHSAADEFASRLLSAVPFRIVDKGIDTSEISRAADGMKQDDCNYIFTLENREGVRIYTTGNSIVAHMYGYQKVVDDYSYVLRTVNVDEQETYAVEYGNIYDAQSVMFDLVDSSSFEGKLNVLLMQVVGGETVITSIPVSEADGFGSVAINDCFAPYAALYNSVYNNEQNEEQEAEQEAFIVEVTTNDPKSNSFTWRNGIVGTFDIIDPIDGIENTIMLDSAGNWYYRSEQVKGEELTNLLQNINAAMPDLSYLNTQYVSMSFALEGTVYPSYVDEYYIDVYVNKTPQHVDSMYFTVQAVELLTIMPRAYPIIFLASGFLLFIFFMFLMFVSGHRYGAEGVKPIWFDKIPFEVFAALNAGAIALLLIDYKLIVYSEVFTKFYSYRLLELALVLMIPFAVGSVIILTAMTIATRLKAHCFWRYTAVGMVVLAIIKVFKFAAYIFSNLRLTWKVVLLCAGVFFLDIIVFIFMLSYYEEAFGLFLWFVGHVLLSLFLILWAIGFTRIRDYSKKIADGELGSKIDRTYLFGDLRRTADDLEGVGEGVKKAVDERMRSERLKTELITNVSHDLKTPLTSIVNYVDILSKDNIEDEAAKEHIGILQRQAARMKKLIEDLVEVSKASSGNVSVNLERTDVNLLLTQTVTEYSQKFGDCGLEPIVKIPEKKMIANLDGRLMWRVLDNLCSNICKYALSHTRVYITAEENGGAIRVSFKNISKYPLDVTGEDLMERFVRGDSSRNTEGSGLGLSIAKSLCDLQGVGFDLLTDGDLFKAELAITCATDDELLNEEPIVYEEPIEFREHVVAPDIEESAETEAEIAEENIAGTDVPAPTEEENS